MANNYFNKIYFGPPGTGKSFKVKELTKSIKEEKNHIFRVTFYEDYSYYDFVGQYKPVVIKDFQKLIAQKKDLKESEKEPSPIISYDFIPGILIKSYIQALKNPSDTVYLIIEEINRGNCSAIFGDVFQLLDRDHNGSKYPIEKSKELANFLLDQIGDETSTLSLPKNLKIIATMNTSDQSLFPIDSAFKRRWQQEYCKIEYDITILSRVKIAGTNILWLDFIKKVNEKILNLLDNEDKQIGHWFAQEYNNEISEDDFKYKVISYLYYDVFKYNRTVFKDNSFSKIIEKPIKEIISGIID